MTITVKTVSGLPEALSSDIKDSTLMQVQVKNNNNKFDSKKLTYSSLSEKIKDDIKQYNTENYGLNTGVSISSEINKLDNILSGNVGLSGQVTFTKKPKYNGSEFTVSSDVTSIIADNNIGFVSPSSQLTNLTVDLNTDGTVSIPKTGILYLEGSVADTGVVSPAQAWVALRAKINDTMTRIQTVPWIMGQKSGQLQYVCFSIPVKEGLEIDIKSGFTTSTSNSNIQNTNNSLNTNGSFNKFTGYIIY